MWGAYHTFRLWQKRPIPRSRSRRHIAAGQSVHRWNHPPRSGKEDRSDGLTKSF